MPTYPFFTVDVFTKRRFGGNPLAVFPDARGLDDATMQALAAELNLSETTFVLPPRDPAHTARVRIFNRTAEMPFAGHPNVGTAFVLAREGRRDDVLELEEPAGIVKVEIMRDGEGRANGATISAPEPLSTGIRLARETIARCVQLDPARVITSAHEPVVASVGLAFVVAEVAADALADAVPDTHALRETIVRHPALAGGCSLYLYSRAETGVRARMFAPLAGTAEDPATGSAAAALGGLLLSLTDDADGQYDIVQGVELGRPGSLRVAARRFDGDIRATVGGTCIPVFRGELEI